MKTIHNSTPKPLNWIWRVIMKPSENELLLNSLAKFSGEKLKHGEYRLKVKNGKIIGVSTIHTTVVDVEDEEVVMPNVVNKLEAANKAADNEEPEYQFN